jgi:hypothetical protein
MIVERIIKLNKAVELAAECTAQHSHSELVVESFQGQLVWEGVVEVFNLLGHPKAKRAYAWVYPEGDEKRIATALEIPPVKSAQTAVRAAIVSGQQK